MEGGRESRLDLGCQTPPMGMKSADEEEHDDASEESSTTQARVKAQPA